jgi:hypothetical protein
MSHPGTATENMQPSEKAPMSDKLAAPAPPPSAADGKTFSIDEESEGRYQRRVRSPEEDALVRKLDWRLMPMLWFMYWFNYLDRNAITVARLDGLEKELGLSSTQYQTCVAILFVGYICAQIPSSEWDPVDFLWLIVPGLFGC